MGGIASSISALGPGNVGGDVAVIRVAQGGEEFEVLLYWDDVAGKWVSEKLPVVIGSVDGDFTEVATTTSTDWVYWGGTPSQLAKWTLKAGGIPFAGALFAAGLKLQDRLCARMLDGGGVIWLSPWFYEYNDNDPIVFSNDGGAQGGKTWNGHADLGFEPSPENIGHGAVLKSDGLNTSKLFGVCTYDDGIAAGGYHLAAARGGGWDYVKFFLPTQPVGAALGGVPTNVPYTPVKKYLYPTLYGINPSGFGAAAISWECRWSS